jgi:hypothetical protein
MSGRRYALAPSAASAPVVSGALGGLTIKATTALPIMIAAIM